MKTDAEILALIREELKRPAITFQGVELRFGYTEADAVAIYRRAFRDGAEAAAGVVTRELDPRLQTGNGESLVAHILGAISAMKRRGTNQGATFARLRGSWLFRANGSNVAGAAVDSLIFPTLAFGALMPHIVAMQFVAKVAGGAIWAAVISKKPATT